MTTGLKRWSFTGVAALALAATLTACAPEQPPADPEVPAIENTQPGSEETAPAGPTPVALPVSFPAEEIPLIKGTVVSASVIPVGDGGWNVVLIPDGPLSQAAEEAKGLLEAKNLVIFTQSTDPTSENRAYRNDSYDVFVNIDDSNGTVAYAILNR